jgi:hypothetical protein
MLETDDEREHERIHKKWIYAVNALRGVCKQLNLAQPPATVKRGRTLDDKLRNR